MTFQQFQRDQNFSPTPYNNNWVDRYTLVLRHEHEFGDNWLLQAKAWFTHQEIDSRSAPNLSPDGVPPPFTTVQDEGFNNGGIDVRLRKLWGDGTIFKGSALTFGGLVYHGDAPFTRFRNPDLFASRDSTDGIQTLDQDRTSDYQALFTEVLLRLGKFHIVPSFRLDHETVDVDTIIGPGAAPGQPFNGHADRWVPLWGIGLGNDFGNRNETYFSASSGWRPVRFFDVASPFQALAADNNPDPFKSLDFEFGVHGTPFKGFWYDVGLFWMEFDNRTETRQFSPIDFIIVNTGSTRHRGLEGELSYDFLARFQHPPLVTVQPEPGKAVIDAKTAPVPGVPKEGFYPLQLIAFSNVQFLDAEFTASDIPDQVGKTPAFAPDFLLKGGLTFRKQDCFNITFTSVYVSQQFWSDMDISLPTVPAKIPAYKVFNLSGEYYITKYLRLIAGISNLTDEKYYSRVFFNGTIEPAPGRSGWAGLSLTF